MRTLTIATRQSPLALWQANYIAQLLREQQPTYNIQLMPLVTAGDRASQQNWPQPTSHKGLFVKELEEALLNQRADLAVHSIKDMSAVLPPTLCLAAISARGNPFDAFISPHYQRLDDLPLHAKIGTASLRRQAQLLAYRPDLSMHIIRGNVQTRIDKLHTQSLDALILAAAGLERLNLPQLIQSTLRPPIMIPACGQGALGVECRADDNEVRTLLQSIHCEASALCVQTERHVNALLGGHCHVPLGIFCEQLADKQLTLTARLLHPSGNRSLETTQTAPADQAVQLAIACVDDLKAQGAQQLLSSLSC